MAVINYRETQIDNMRQIIWEGITGGDTCQPVKLSERLNRHVYGLGTVGTDLSVSLCVTSDTDEFENDTPAPDGSPKKWVIAVDAQGQEITKTSLPFSEEIINSNPYWAPYVPTGTGSSVTVILTVVKEGV